MSLPTAMKILAVGVLLSTTKGAFSQDLPMPAQLPAALDSNGDGRLQAEEWASFRARQFDRLDVDSDGMLDAEEISGALERLETLGRGAAASFLDDTNRLAALDSDEDGAISQEEFVRAEPSRFSQADTDGDGALSMQELRQFRQAARQ